MNRGHSILAILAAAVMVVLCINVAVTGLSDRKPDATTRQSVERYAVSFVADGNGGQGTVLWRMWSDGRVEQMLIQYDGTGKWYAFPRSATPREE